MTLQTQTPGGEPQPIPVKEAVEAVQAAIEACDFDLAWTAAEWKGVKGSQTTGHVRFVLAARAGYAATLEYLLHILEGDLSEGHGLVPVWMSEYRAVAPIVAWHRAQKESGR